MPTRIKPPKRQPERGSGRTRLTPKEREEATRQKAREIVASGQQAEWAWIVRMIVPEKYRSGPDDDGDERLACWPGDKLPAILFSEDETGYLTDLMVRGFVADNPPDTIFYKTLTTVSILKEMMDGRWYEWGALIQDRICSECGQVFRVGVMEEWQGCDCRYPRSAQRRAFVEGVLYELKEVV